MHLRLVPATLLRLLAATAAVVAVAVGLSPSSPAFATTNTWLSGVYPAVGIDTSAGNAFGAYRGRPVDLAVVYVARTSWDKLATQSWETQQYADFAGSLVEGVPLTISGTSLAQVATGAYDSYYRSMAKSLVSLGRGASVIRLGWEFNGNWQPWTPTSPTDYINAFRHVVKVLRGVSSSFKIDWNGNEGKSQSGYDPFTQLYPGDRYVDIVGVDAYDGWWTYITDRTSFNAWANQSGGIYKWLAFATAHSKKLSVPEWGSLSTGLDGSTAYIDGMHDFFQTNAANIAYEAYFNDPYSIKDSLEGPIQLSNWSSEYAKLW